MNTVNELYLGFSDAQNYALRQNKQAFNEIFVRNVFLDDILKPSTFFLIGEKGTGKTAYATFLSNNEYKENKSSTTFLSATDYEKFYILKKKKNLDLAAYSNIWKVIIMLLLCKNVAENDKVISLFSKSTIGDLLAAIDEYYLNAFAPEVTNVMKMIDDSEIVAKLICKYVEVGGCDSSKMEFTETRFQQNLYYIEKKFTEAISKLKLCKNINLFIDGIDIRPETIPYQEYIECIRGLANATWLLNTSLFQNVRDSKGTFRVILLLRPDIYSSLNLQNAMNKILDNSVFLDWRTTYQDYRTSHLYKVGVNILLYKQDYNTGDIWDEYFDWKIPSTGMEREYDTAFIAFLKISLSRPRDILVILQYLQRKMKKDGYGYSTKFSYQSFNSNEFQNNYSEYFISSLKDQLSFYYSSVDFEHFLKLFDFFSYSEFSYRDYMLSYEKFVEYILEKADDIAEFFDDSTKLLQLLYDSNVITAIEAIENGRFNFHFSYREKNSANINPKVPIGDNITYRFHYGLYKKTKFGRY